MVLFHFEVGLGELLAEADVVSLHLPLGPDTAGLVDVRKPDWTFLQRSPCRPAIRCLP
jgi:hypothetical protein